MARIETVTSRLSPFAVLRSRLETPERLSDVPPPLLNVPGAPSSQPVCLVAHAHPFLVRDQRLAMAVDLLAASRRPLQRLLQECSFSEWENIALFLDDGTTEAVRWAGGLGFLLEELGISQVLDLQVGARLLVLSPYDMVCKFVDYASVLRIGFVDRSMCHTHGGTATRRWHVDITADAETGHSTDILRSM